MLLVPTIGWWDYLRQWLGHSTQATMHSVSHSRERQDSGQRSACNKIQNNQQVLTVLSVSMHQHFLFYFSSFICQVSERRSLFDPLRWCNAELQNDSFMFIKRNNSFIPVYSPFQMSQKWMTSHLGVTVLFKSKFGYWWSRIHVSRADCSVGLRCTVALKWHIFK